MNRTQREKIRASQDAIRQQHAQFAIRREQEAVRKEVAIQVALQKKNAAKWASNTFVGTPTFAEVAKALQTRAPKLLEGEYLVALQRLTKLAPVRSMDTWQPRGKGRDTLFRSVCDHLLAKYPVPALLWNAFFEKDHVNASRFSDLVGHVAGGGSLSEYIKANEFPIPLTRKMCHELLTMTADHGFLAAIRQVQVRSAGGDKRFFNAYISTTQANTLGSKADEEFWQTVIDWFAKNPMLNPSEVGPLMDFIHFKKREDPKFSLKGRGMVPMLRGMHEWHNGLQITKNFRDKVFLPSGFKGAEFDDYSRMEEGDKVHEKWIVREILSNKELLDEGRRMGHCVYSYGSHVESGRTSIWQLVMEDKRGPTGRWAMLTVEVNNTTRMIVQARGRYNKLPDHRAHTVLLRWANLAQLQVSLGRW